MLVFVEISLFLEIRSGSINYVFESRIIKQNGNYKELYNI